MTNLSVGREFVSRPIDGIAACGAESEKQESWYAFTLVSDYFAYNRDGRDVMSHSSPCN